MFFWFNGNPFLDVVFPLKTKRKILEEFRNVEKPGKRVFLSIVCQTLFISGPPASDILPDMCFSFGVNIKLWCSFGFGLTATSTWVPSLKRGGWFGADTLPSTNIAPVGRYLEDQLPLVGPLSDTTLVREQQLKMHRTEQAKSKPIVARSSSKWKFEPFLRLCLAT